MKLTYVLPGHVEVSVLERCPSYGMSVLKGFTVLYVNDSYTTHDGLMFCRPKCTSVFVVSSFYTSQYIDICYRDQNRAGALLMGGIRGFRLPYYH